MIRVAIVGCGPWGLAVMERMVACLSDTMYETLEIELHIVEPNRPGEGVYSKELPNYLLLNTECAQIDLFGHKYIGDKISSPFECLNFYEWLRKNCYMVNEYGHWREVLPTDYLPRNVLSDYLNWAFANIAQHSPPNLTLYLHRKEAIDIVKEDDSEIIVMSDGEKLAVTSIFLTIGHALSVNFSEARQAKHVRGTPLLPFPHNQLDRLIQPEESVIVQGMGLTAIDVISCLTIGRGGKFKRMSSGELNYLPSGREPKLLLCSRNGTPYLARPLSISKDRGSFKPAFLTHEKIEQLHHFGKKIDFREDILPDLFREMKMEYAQRQLSVSKARSAQVNASASGGEVVELDVDIDIERIFWGFSQQTFFDALDYEAQVVKHLATDIEESRSTEGTPLKSALEVLRFLRDSIRSIIDFDGLSEHSFIDFRTHIQPMFYRLTVGPPVNKLQELLALIKAGIVRFPFGPAPDITYDNTCGKWIAKASRLQRCKEMHVDHVVKGYVENNNLSGNTSSILVKNLLYSGRIHQDEKYSGTGCGIQISSDFHPLQVGGKEEANIYVLGLLTEGKRNFNLYIPSPGSRLRAFLDADACVKQLLQRSGQPYQNLKGSSS